MRWLRFQLNVFCLEVINLAASMLDVTTLCQAWNFLVFEMFVSAHFRLQHFDFVRTADLHRIGLSAPAIGRIKEAIKIHRENAGLPRNPRKKHHYGLSFGIPLLDLDVNLHKENNGHLGSGSFGVVRRGDWKTPTGKTIPVALKILRHDAANFFSTVLSEVMLMQSVSHPNLVRIYGIIPLNPLVIVTELAPLGSLLTALRAHSRHVLWDIGIQLARGMAHLAACHLIHRDLAARNVLLFSAPSDVVVKIGDFGLLRRVPGCVYVGIGKQKIPFAWSPPEAICGRCFSQASDVWSWGVTVWEVWTGGAEPWPGLSSDAVLAELKAAHRLTWPRTTCPRRLYQLLLAAWRYDPAHRPSFEYLVGRLDKVCSVICNFCTNGMLFTTNFWTLVNDICHNCTTMVAFCLYFSFRLHLDSLRFDNVIARPPVAC
ncbi:unnamed protein product [Hydatigera taeniaeformis]|uniref:non-specific protein-tyrosine kinase n=1 Tax=Hydatigena taeniaeformis TaxID=6205 RepID=A0A158RE79_HYDTA|nr:unnamed protein product [Hydatigera taeniaeformis]